MTKETSYPLPTIIIQDDPFCCGSRLYGNFPSSKIVRDPKYGTHYVALTEDDKKQILKKALLVTYGAHATLAGSQIEAWGSTLKSFGFTESKTFTNPNSGNRVALYTYSPADKKPKSK